MEKLLEIKKVSICTHISKNFSENFQNPKTIPAWMCQNSGKYLPLVTMDFGTPDLRTMDFRTPKVRSPEIVSCDNIVYGWFLRTYHEDQRPYKCNQCDKAFHLSGGLKVHIQTVHEGQRNYKCESCEKTFTQINHFKRHIQTVHEGFRYECNYCGNLFSQKVSLERHTSTVHEGQLKVKCDQCENYFSTPQILKKGPFINYVVKNGYFSVDRLSQAQNSYIW